MKARLVKRILFLAVIPLLISSCRKKSTTSDIFPCGDIRLDSITRSDNWLELPFYQSPQYIFYTKKSGEVSHSIGGPLQINDSEFEGLFRKPCDVNINYLQDVRVNSWETQRSFELETPSHEKFSLYYRIAPRHSWYEGHQWQEYLVVHASIHQNDSTIQHSSLIILVDDIHFSNPDHNIDFDEPVNEFTVGDITAQDVYISDDSLLYYTHDKGIIAFRDGTDLWILND